MICRFDSWVYSVGSSTSSIGSGLVDRNPCFVWSRWPSEVATGFGACFRISAADIPGKVINPLSMAFVNVVNAGEPNVPCQKAATSDCVRT